MSVFVTEGVVTLRDSARSDDRGLAAARERSTARSQRTSLLRLWTWTQSLVLSSTHGISILSSLVQG
jgi:hypothetical protein